MCKRFFFTTTTLLLFLFIGLTSLRALNPTGSIVLQDEPLALKPVGFYIANVADERSSKNAIAQLIVKAPGNKMLVQPADLQGGPSKAIQQFMERNLPKNEAERPVIMSLKELKITETSLAGNRVEGSIRLYLSFGLQKDWGTDLLVGYGSTFRYVRSADNANVVEPQLRKALRNGLNYFNDWMKTNDGMNVKLARNVKFIFTNYTDKTEGDTIYYTAKRPLTWADFQSKYKPSGTFSAMVMPSIAYEQHASIKDGTIYVNIAMKAFVPKSTCWVSYNAKEDYTLNHEQKHFDIVKIIAEQYKRKVLAEKLTPDTYEAFLSMQYLDSYRDMDAMQLAYDNETGHGRDRYVQSQWDEKIEKELKTLTK
ncbi:hypothetical protein [Mucilaginibacter sp. PAMB04168]|uniref:hypothetical protein n=1 Tax=Mucilaginibacter sp. PAMB04168 TaxID=3138567 RepID=UPI0031F60DBF